MLWNPYKHQSDGGVGQGWGSPYVYLRFILGELAQKKFKMGNVIHNDAIYPPPPLRFSTL